MIKRYDVPEGYLTRIYEDDGERGRAVKYADHLRECNKRARRVAMDAFEHYRKVCKFPRSSALFADCLETVLQDAALRELGGEAAQTTASRHALNCSGYYGNEPCDCGAK